MVPIVSIWFTARDLFGVGESEDRAKEIEMVKVLKMFEHIGKANSCLMGISSQCILFSGEALPQLIHQLCVYSSQWGSFSAYFEYNLCIFLSNKLPLRLLISVDAFRRNRKEKVALGMPYN